MPEQIQRHLILIDCATLERTPVFTLIRLQSDIVWRRRAATYNPNSEKNWDAM